MPTPSEYIGRTVQVIDDPERWVIEEEAFGFKINGETGLVSNVDESWFFPILVKFENGFYHYFNPNELTIIK